MSEKEQTSPVSETTRTIRGSSSTLTRGVVLFVALMFGLPFFGALAGICGLFVATGFQIAHPYGPPPDIATVTAEAWNITVTSLVERGPDKPEGLRGRIYPRPGNILAELEWESGEDGHVTGYRVERRVDGGAWTSRGEREWYARGQNKTDEGLQPGTTYYYRVVAYNDWAESVPSDPVTLHAPEGKELADRLTAIADIQATRDAFRDLQ